MTIQFDFLTANRILFRRKAFAELGKITSEFGTRALVVLGRSHRFGEEARQLLHSNGVEASIFTARDEPTVDEVSAGIQQAREFDANVVLAIGGGSAIDLGKAIAGLLTNDGSIYEYMEGAGPVKKFTQPSMPFVVVPQPAHGQRGERNASTQTEAPVKRELRRESAAARCRSGSELKARYQKPSPPFGNGCPDQLDNPFCRICQPDDRYGFARRHSLCGEIAEEGFYDPR